MAYWRAAFQGEWPPDAANAGPTPRSELAAHSRNPLSQVRIVLYSKTPTPGDVGDA